MTTLPILSSSRSSIPDEQHDTGVRAREVFFLDQAALDQRVRDRSVVLDGSILLVAGAAQRYVVRDAVRVLGPVGSGVDVFGLTGRIMPVSEVLVMGATLNAHTMRIGSVQYDAQLGYLAQVIH